MFWRPRCVVGDFKEPPPPVGAPQRHLPHNPQKKGKSSEMQFKHWYEAFSMSYMLVPLYIEQPTLYNESMLMYSVIVVHARLSKTHGLLSL